VANEAMAAGIPVIVSDRIGSANDLVINGKTGLVVPQGNVSNLAEAIIRLAADRDTRNKLGREGHLHVMANYSLARAVERAHEITALVLGHRHVVA
jgi:glycosyltransferase involved in cell wall biosynthesis